MTVQQVRTPDGRVFWVTSHGFAPEDRFLKAGKPIGRDLQAALADLRLALASVGA